jgi:hypothetical protein
LFQRLTAVSKFHRTCGAVSEFQSFSASLFQSFIAPTVLFQSSRFHRFAVSAFHRTCGAVSELQSFTASLFQHFIAPTVLFQSFRVSPLRCFNVS